MNCHMENPESTVTVGVAAASHLREAYHVRYLAFMNRGDDRYANHDLQLMTDQLDGREGTLLLVALDGEGKVVGSIRLVERAAGPFICDDLYHWEAIGVMLGVDTATAKRRTVLMDRLAVRPGSRNSGLSKNLVEHGLKLIESRQFKIAVVVVRTQDTRMINFFLRRGWSTIGNATGNGIDAVQLVTRLY